MFSLRTVWEGQRRRVTTLALLAAALIGTGAVMTARGSGQPVAATTPAVAAPALPATLLVFVSGAVAHPGLYELATGARIADAVAAAGGVLPSADPGHMPDLAGLVHDGHQVNVPFLKGSSSAASLRIDVNTASVEELQTIPGMSADLAQAVVSARDSSGPFANLRDLRTAIGLDVATAALIGKHLRFVTSVG